jgi:tRNA (guanine37-N1)-methyltransferase
MRISVVSIFPQMFAAVTEYGVTGRAIRNSIVNIELIDLREYGQGLHKILDDRPFGGGPGMVMLAEPIISCISKLRRGESENTPVIYLSPQGRRLQHEDVCKLADLPELILLCGRYEGIDQRALDIIQAQEWSIGDYVLSGGELAAMVMIDAVVRQLPGVLGNAESSSEDSFTNGLLDCIHYTRPQVVQGLPVPEVLTSGNHKQIRQWRMKQSIGRTWLRRPDLFEKFELDDESTKALEEFQDEYENLEKS